ncbi:unnamed protein product [Rotaria sp. Silwood1]|nr:unnamed protein product [Rotaria sp. Silwood1]
MANDLDLKNNFECKLNEMLADLDNHDFLQSFPTRSNVKYDISIQNPSLASLKKKIDHFFQQYPAIISDIKNHFYEDLIMYAVKCTFDPSFTNDDITRTNELFNNFFIQQEKHIKIIFDHFFDDVKPLILKSKFSHSKVLYHSINVVPKFVAREVSITCLKKLGASILTSFMYSNQTNSAQHQDESLFIRSSPLTYSFLNKRKVFLLLVFLILLCAIFGFKIFHLIFYYFIGLLCTMLALYIFLKC